MSKTRAAIATLPQLLDGYIIEDEHLIMAETVFTFMLMIATLLLLWKPRTAWWTAAVAGLLVGAAAMVRTEGEVMLAVLPMWLLLRGWGWRTLRGWAVTIVFAVGMLVPVGVYVSWFHQKTGPRGHELHLHGYRDGRQDVQELRPGQPRRQQGADRLRDRPVTAQPLDYIKTVVKGTLLSFGFPRIGYPVSGTTYYYSFHFNYVGTDPATGKPVSLLPPKTVAKVPPLVLPKNSVYNDWLNYGHQAPGVVHKIFAAPIAVYQRVVFTYGPLLAVIFLVGLGGWFAVTGRRRGTGVRSLLSVDTLRSLRLHWRPRGTSMLPWWTAVALLVAPIAVADFDYRYLIPVIPFAAMAAGLSFAPRKGVDQHMPSGPHAEVESTVPDSVP